MKARINKEPKKIGIERKMDMRSMRLAESRIQSSPTHNVKITTEFGEKMINICNMSNTHLSETEIPSDIVFAKTIPMTDFTIEIIEDNSKKVHPLIRVTMFDNYEQSVESVGLDSTTLTLVGLVIFDYGFIKPYVTFGISPGDEAITILPDICIFGAKSPNDYQRQISKIGFTETEMGGLSHAVLRIWYGIQVSLLNPVIRKTFHRSVVEEQKTPINISSNNKKKPPIKYKKVVYLDDDFIEKNEDIKRIFTRKTQCWYVTGHWRNQAIKDGHKLIFIQGYWKGIAKETKSTDPREREIILNDD